MKSTQVNRTVVGKNVVHTAFIEPFGYYEVAVLYECNNRDKVWTVIESNISDKDEALHVHNQTVEGIK
jgi:hypothetical protein